jgi:NAD-dependent dihydropyrimidine dehydrogenase PreA subunit
MSLTHGKISIDYELCSTCTQCIAICPQRALLWNGSEPEPFNDELLPLPEQMDELFKQRRTVRHFKTDKPGRRFLQQIINYGAYAPSHSHDFRVIIVGGKRIPLSLESAQYMLYNIDLYAKSKGLGCRNLVGNQMFFNRSRLIRRTLGINGREKIFAAFGIGYPLKKFRNKVQGRELPVQWNTPEC